MDRITAKDVRLPTERRSRTVFRCEIDDQGRITGDLISAEMDVCASCDREELRLPIENDDGSPGYDFITYDGALCKECERRFQAIAAFEDLRDAVAEVGALLDDVGERLAALSAPREGDNIELFGIVNPRGEFAFIELDAPGRPALYWEREVAEHELAELQEPGAVNHATADGERETAELRVRTFRIIPSDKNED